MPTTPLYLLAGESRTYELAVTDEAGLPVDLTGAEVEFQMKRQIGDPDPPVLAKWIGADITLLAQIGDTLGRARLEFLPADTALLAGTFVFDVVVTSAGRRQYVIAPSEAFVQQVVNSS
jgi:hypothetical protein